MPSVHRLYDCLRTTEAKIPLLPELYSATISTQITISGPFAHIIIEGPLTQQIEVNNANLLLAVTCDAAYLVRTTLSHSPRQPIHHHP